MIYFLIDSSGLIVGNVLWDGQAQWNPPDGCEVLKKPKDSPAGIGWSYIDGQFTPPPDPE